MTYPRLEAGAEASGEIIEDERLEQIKWNTLNARRHATLATLDCSVVSVSNSGRNAVTGDGQGAVKLYSYPPEQSGHTTVSLIRKLRTFLSNQLLRIIKSHAKYAFIVSLISL